MPCLDFIQQNGFIIMLENKIEQRCFLNFFYFYIFFLAISPFSSPIAICDLFQGVVKPDIVFFGESLPLKFFKSAADLPRADLLIIMGTSLEVLRHFLLLH